ncbi:hypothetical protein XELAEV_18025211mg [Xenopus laevis]|uniref:Uncharacterized protein n=1 Tax=Xenopus laevis TaxID=8355 RepID=A0A974HM55_XENLA|nr:hypothetical protein XELAEV_18025211mg [Xenopus laevis]
MSFLGGAKIQHRSDFCLHALPLLFVSLLQLPRVRVRSRTLWPMRPGKRKRTIPAFYSLFFPPCSSCTVFVVFQRCKETGKRRNLQKKNVKHMYYK